MFLEALRLYLSLFTLISSYLTINYTFLLF